MEGQIMAGLSNRRLKLFSSGVAKILNSRVGGVLAILGMVTAASLHAQDKTQPTAPTKAAPSTANPAPPSSPADRAPDKSGSTDAPKKEVPASTAPSPSGPGAGGPPRLDEKAFREQAVRDTLTAVVLGNSAARRFQFTIDPKTPLKDLLPTPPTTKNLATPAIAKGLSDVPEIQFQMPLDKKQPNEESLKQTAHTMAKINHLNDKNPDGFLKALRGDRVDLAGLPFAMGETCRTTGDRSKQFAIEVNLVRAALQATGNAVTFNISNVDGTIASMTQFLSLASQPLPPTVPLTADVAVPAPAQPGSTVQSPTPAPATLPQPPTLPGSAPVPQAPAPPAGSGGPPPSTGVPAPTPAIQPPVAGPSASTVVNLNQVAEGPAGSLISADKFWEKYQTICANADKELSKSDPCRKEIVTLARIAALMQVLAPESPDMRLGLVKYLSAISHTQATRALAKMSIFSAEDAVRQAAIDSLKVRRERDYTDILIGGLRYPWPDVARRSAEAMVKLDRTDLIPQLVDFLDESDPRTPVVREADNKKVFEARELVRINHHRNCLLCHAPANTGKVAAETLTAAVPTPQVPLPSPSQGYQSSIPDILVRLDVTYLRQDFSMLQPVADASPWPEMQRFDFLVRTRTLTEKEADEYREKLSNKEPGVLSPYHRAAVGALRELTGRDAAPNSDAWRQLLKLPMKPVRTVMAR
jgi:hypothetical protein